MADKPYILHMLTPGAQMSPFDINMACDAGYGVVVPHTQVELSQVGALTQDAIFSRGPKGVRRTGLFIGGRDNFLAADMFEAACRAMVPPFAASVMVDPSGAFTTAAAAIACIERSLQSTDQNLSAKRFAIFGGTGPVGAAAAVLAAQRGARVGMVARADLARTENFCAQVSKRYGLEIGVLDATTPSTRATVLSEMQVALATAKAGVTVLTASDLAAAPMLLLAADVNAVPPAGIEGIGAMDDGVELLPTPKRAAGIGALAIGNIKYQTEKGLLETMLAAESARYLGLAEALTEARHRVGLS